jgi:hypothetical protein
MCETIRLWCWHFEEGKAPSLNHGHDDYRRRFGIMEKLLRTTVPEGIEWVEEDGMSTLAYINIFCDYVGRCMTKRRKCHVQMGWREGEGI